MFNFNIFTSHLLWWLSILNSWVLDLSLFLLAVRSVPVSIISEGAMLIKKSGWLGFCLANTLTVKAAGKLIFWHLLVLAQTLQHGSSSYRIFW